MIQTNHEQEAIFNPEAYSGKVIRPSTPQAKNQTCSIAEAATYNRLPPIIKRYGIWAICQDGIHSLYVKYHVSKDRFDEDDWIPHVTEKMWVEKFDFIAAFETAKYMAEAGEI